MKYIVSIIFCLVALIGCGGSDNARSKQEPLEKAPQSIETVKDVIDALKAKGDIPTLDRSDSLAGPDENSNGVRDDIDDYIMKLALDDKKQRAAVEMAKSLQRIQTEEVLTLDISESISEQSIIAVSCFVDTFHIPGVSYGESNKIFSKLQFYTANTYERAERYYNYNELRNGTVSRLPGDIDC